LGMTRQPICTLPEGTASDIRTGVGDREKEIADTRGRDWQGRVKRLVAWVRGIIKEIRR
jgi:hypothetical protein